MHMTDLATTATFMQVIDILRHQKHLPLKLTLQSGQRLMRGEAARK